MPTPARSRDTPEPGPRIYAHRGSTVLAPENTSAAFDLALHFQADVLETDVRLSRDGVVMVTHDERLDRTTNGQGRVLDHRATEITRLDAGHHFIDLDGRQWRNDGARIESLDELFARYPNVHINIDIKDRSDAAAQAVAQSIERAGREQSVTVGSFHASTLARFRQCSPQVTTAASQSEVARLYFSPIGPRKARTTQSHCFDYVQIPVSWWGLPLARPAFIQRAKQQGLQMIYWTINDRSLMQRLVSAGADGIVTDRPDVAQALLRSQ
jgi:glycerophosphoryl diester phosphodiesterase